MSEKEMRKTDECDVETFGNLLIHSGEETIVILGDRWWPQTAKQERVKISKILCNVWKNLMSVQMLPVPLLGAGTVLRLKRDAWSMAK